jgi:deoxyribonuclease-4
VDQIERLWEKVAEFGVGFCFDTCHAHAAGEDLTDVVERVLKVVGKIDVLHCNSSRDRPGTGADRHANLSTGTMDVEGILSMIQVSKAPVVIFETPWPGISEDIDWLREQIGAKRT